MQSSRIRAEVEVDSQVLIRRNRKSVRIKALAKIHNDSDEHFVLGATDTASAHSWQILDEDGREVARESAGKSKRPPKGRHPFVSTMVASNHSVRELETVDVPASKLKHGALYTLRHNHFGYIGEAQFIAVREPAKKKAKAKRKPAKKKAAAKRKPAKKKAATKRKPAKKKAAAKRKPAKKKAATKRKPAARKAAKKTAAKRSRKKTARKR